MKKTDFLIIALLFMLLLLWPFLYNHVEKALGIERKPVERQDVSASREQADFGENTTDLEPPALGADLKPDYPDEVDSVEKPVVKPSGDLDDDYSIPAVSGETVELNAEKVSFKFTSRGAGLVSAKLAEYRSTVDEDSEPVILDFSERPALIYSGLPGFSGADAFTVNPGGTDSLQAFAGREDGLQLTRTITLESDYRVKVRDVFANTGSAPVNMSQHRFWLGPMALPEEYTKVRGFEFLGVDVQPAIGGESVLYLSKYLPKIFKEKRDSLGNDVLPVFVSDKDVRVLGEKHKLVNPLPMLNPVDWVAVKNKFFVQIAEPEERGEGYSFVSFREMLPGEGVEPGVKSKNAVIENVNAALVFNEAELQPGTELAREIYYYIGPKKYSILKDLGKNQAAVMEFGFWTPVCKLLITALNFIYDYVPNYGLAIILLTIGLRVIFWPVTRKSTESMKKMQQLQPMIAELKKKYKSDPKKLNEETMRLYKERKVNPMGGCLPMLIQIPVFIAFFVVLRSAVELRFAGFLWVNDLSEPERLFSDVLPFPLNILPIIMAATMIWQQKLTPTTDASQQKMMMIFMPAMMLFICYNFPSALALYWTANQVIAIIMQLIQQWKTRHEESAVVPA